MGGGMEFPPVFGTLPDDAKNVLDSYDVCIKSAMPLPPQKERLLPKTIFALALSLTSERGGRRIGYLNDPANIAAYIWYYHWWNLARLTRLFAALPADFFCAPDGGVCADIGSGPLTAVSAMYLSRPELREKNLTWYCVDRSRAVMEKGEDLFFAARAALTPSGGQRKPGEWNIVRIQSGAGTFARRDVQLRKKANLVIAANVYNEILEQQRGSLERFAASAAAQLASYGEPDASVIVVEPGVPRSARFVSLMRDSFLTALNARVVSPCPHSEKCPMDGNRSAGAKWCHFSFPTDDAPQKLVKLSETARMPKERAALSFIAARFEGAGRGAARDSGAIPARVASELIKLPGGRAGVYGCSALGLTLIDTPLNKKTPRAGDIVFVTVPRKSEIDKKSGAVIVKEAGSSGISIR
ncbi:MAG: small ribosomal subunit Rsm22 family protein [Treponemataceae bacterium]|nr:MAG: small ribosomal subunit Rsm22 family protein [Treponemataceae bacterium]